MQLQQRKAEAGEGVQAETSKAFPRLGVPSLALPLASFCFPLTTPTPMPSKVFLVRKVTRPDSGHLYAMKVLKKATLKGEWGVPPHRASGWAEIEGR